MKKLPAVLVVVLLFAAGLAAAWHFWRGSAPRASRIAECLPADTALFLHVPDVRRTRGRWPKTALAQITAEPEMQAFLQKPKARLAENAEWRSQRERLGKIDPGEIFLAVTQLTDKAGPKVLAGFAFHGKKEDAASLLADARAAAQRSWPAGKADIAQAGGDEIETFTFAGNTLATVVRKDWAFIGNDVELMKNTLARMDGKTGADSLKGNEAFQKSLAQLPAEWDALGFVQMRGVTEKLASLMAMTNPAADTRQLDEFRKIESIAWATKLDGANIRDSIFMLKPGEAKGAVMPRHSLALSSPDTLVFHVFSIEKFSQLSALPPGATAMLGSLQKTADAFAALGLTLADFGRAFGPEAGILVDWPAAAPMPSLLLALDVRDAALAAKWTGALSQATGGPAGWKSQTDGGVDFLTTSQLVSGMFPVELTLGTTDKFLLGGLSLASVKSAAARAKTSSSQLSTVPAFGEAAKAVQEPTSAFSYMGARAAFERVYGLLRPYVMMGAAFAAPRAGEFVDVGKLPAPDTIAKHLGPIVYSQSSVENGVLSESAGPVTYSQATGVMIAGAAAALLQNKFGAPGAGGMALPLPAASAPAGSAPAGWSGHAAKLPPAPMPSASP